ncbi:MAG: M23 family metallopeptidase [Anaerolineales bacterium]|nr:M23 family metallopeptidase [Anaerolineales bacterium]MCW5854828.1 M23 family metallopeptidase [Anaerolineales bacterium]
MSKIVVNTEQLRKQARDLQKASDDLRAVSGQISVLINSVNNDVYEGQLTQKIRELLGGVESRAGQLAGGLSELQKELNRRAALFDEANRQTLQCIAPLTRISNFTIDQTTGEIKYAPPPIEKPFPQARQKEITKPVGEGAKFERGVTEKHKGVDISGGGQNLPIVAMMPGTIVWTSIVSAGTIAPDSVEGENALKDSSINYGYGNSLITEYKYDNQSKEIQKQLEQEYGLSKGQSLYAYHAHLDSISVKEGTKVKPGEEIATMGNDGRSTGIHLHLEFAVGSSDSVGSYDEWKVLGKQDPNKLLKD